MRGVLAWYVHCKKVLEAAGFVESRLEQGFYYLPGPDGLEAVAHTHVDDWFQEGLQDIQGCPEAYCAHSSREATVWHRRAMWLDHFQGCESHTVNQAKSQLGLEYLSIDLAG